MGGEGHAVGAWTPKCKAVTCCAQRVCKSHMGVCHRVCWRVSCRRVCVPDSFDTDYMKLIGFTLATSLLYTPQLRIPPSGLAFDNPTSSPGAETG